MSTGTAYTYSDALQSQLDLIEYWHGNGGRFEAIFKLQREHELRPGSVLSGVRPEDVMREVQLMLDGATTYYVSNEICGVLQRALLDVPDEATIERYDLPVTNGYVRFARPMYYRVGRSHFDPNDEDPYGMREAIRKGATRAQLAAMVPQAGVPFPIVAMAWRLNDPDLADERTTWSNMDRARTVRNAVRFTFFSEDGMAGDPDMKRFGINFNVPAYCDLSPFGYGQTVAQTRDTLRAQYGDLVLVKDSVQEQQMEYDSVDLKKLAIGFLQFIKQKFITMSVSQADRPTRRRLEKLRFRPPEHNEPLIQIVTLRKVEHHRATGEEPEPVDWNYRWWVSAHWRYARCGPGNTERKWVYVNTFIKGPDDRPLKPMKAKLFAVVR